MQGLLQAEELPLDGRDERLRRATVNSFTVSSQDLSLISQINTPQSLKSILTLIKGPTFDSRLSQGLSLFWNEEELLMEELPPEPLEHPII